jgi:hypothetical protein
MNPQRPRKPKNISPGSRNRALELLRPAALDLVALMNRVKQMSEADLKLSDVLDVLEGMGRASTRLANLLQAEQELGAGDDRDEAIDQAIAELFGHRPLFQPEGNGGVEGGDPPPPA